MSKKTISLALALIMAVGLFTIPTLAADSPSSWAVEQVNKAIEAKLVPQSLQSKYTQATTRAEFCALAVALYENVKGTITGRTTFTDTTDVNVEKMASVGVVSGVGNNKFAPDDKLTREQAAVMLSRLAEAVGKPFEKKAATFADNGKVSSWALEGVGQVQAAGIMSGTGNNMFSPKDPYTREQSIITIMRTFDAIKGGTGTTEPTTPPSGGVNSELVGHWQGIFEGTEYYYEFKADGTFIHYRCSFPYGSTNWVSRHWYLRKGHWSESAGVISMTQISMTEWRGADAVTHNELKWVNAADIVLRFSGVHEPDNRSSVRYILDLDLVTDIGYAELQNEEFPDWQYYNDGDPA